MRRRLLAILGTAACLAGCEEPAPLALVVRTDAMTRRTWNIAPTIPLRRPNGTETTLARAAGPFYLLAFVEMNPESPCAVSPAVQAIARKFEWDDLAVVQISTPPTPCSLGDSWTRCLPPKDNLILVLDPQRLAWEMFLRPPPGTLLLIDADGYISSRGTLADSRNILFDAFQMREKWERENLWRRYSSFHPWLDD